MSHPIRPEQVTPYNYVPQELEVDELTALMQKVTQHFNACSPVVWFSFGELPNAQGTCYCQGEDWPLLRRADFVWTYILLACVWQTL